MTNPSLVEGSELDTCEFFSTMEESKNIFDYIKALNEDTLPTKYHVAWYVCIFYRTSVAVCFFSINLNYVFFYFVNYLSLLLRIL